MCAPPCAARWRTARSVCARAPTGRRRDTATRASAQPSDAAAQGRHAHTPGRCRRDGVEACPGRLDATPPHAIEQTPFGHRSKPDTEANLGTCAACARRTAGYIEKTKAIFFGRQREGDGPSRRLAFAQRVDHSSFEGALITFSAAGARRPVAAAQNASSSTAPVTTSSLWRFWRASSVWSNFALLMTSALLAVGCFSCSGTGCCSPLLLRRLIHAVMASFASHNVA